jgi:glutathione S-transferase
MKILGSITSPFVRTVRTLAYELLCDFEFQETPAFSKLDTEAEALIRQSNPLGKVPVLLIDDFAIPDSRVIARILIERFHAKADEPSRFVMTVADENLVTVINGVLDAGILRFMLQHSHPELNAHSGYMEKSLSRVEDGLRWIASQPGLDKHFGYPQISLMCALDWLEKRKVFAWQQHESLKRFHAKYCDQPSLLKTRIPDGA